MSQKQIRLACGDSNNKNSYYLVDIACLIGEGQFGKVYQGKKFMNGIEQSELYAVKIVHSSGQEDAEVDLERELEIARKVKGDYICKVFFAAKVKSLPFNSIYIVTEYCDQGTLKQYCQKQKPTLMKLIEIFYCIVKGYKESLHDYNILHRDLKPENILMKNHIPKIADFGLGKINNQLQVPIEQTFKCTPLFGSPQIYAEDCTYSYKTDIYSLGVLFYTLTNEQYNPNFLKTIPELKKFLAGLKINPIQKYLKFKDEDLPQDIKELTYKMMAYEENERIDINSLLFEIDRIRKGFNQNGTYQSYKNTFNGQTGGYNSINILNQNKQNQNENTLNQDQINNQRNSKDFQSDKNNQFTYNKIQSSPNDLNGLKFQDNNFNQQSQQSNQQIGINQFNFQKNEDNKNQPFDDLKKNYSSQQAQMQYQQKQENQDKQQFQYFQNKNMQYQQPNKQFPLNNQPSYPYQPQNQNDQSQKVFKLLPFEQPQGQNTNQFQMQNFSSPKTGQNQQNSHRNSTQELQFQLNNLNINQDGQPTQIPISHNLQNQQQYQQQTQQFVFQNNQQNNNQFQKNPRFATWQDQYSSNPQQQQNQNQQQNPQFQFMNNNK